MDYNNARKNYVSILLMDQETAGYVNSFTSESYSICTSVLQGAKLGRLLYDWYMIFTYKSTS